MYILLRNTLADNYLLVVIETEHPDVLVVRQRVHGLNQTLQI